MNPSKKAFALLEVLIFILVLSILMTAILGSFAVMGIENLRNPQKIAVDNVPLCNKIAPRCVFQSSIVESTQFYEIQTTTP
ncbi:type II secretion system protein [Helicobacter sp. MIT 05-5294]|uniref:type IV pilus modification PilV family protein n=1 Tax=Helicobacter sp. MIT 05-5294 TaxID=1548150 RepID=UPI00051FA422|nr:type II secretion system protein [Helicobacter sp. MIT 05-5294]TLD85433.1 type II secretion system protein [Helicobacter sp. MIT 05-5294]